MQSYIDDIEGSGQHHSESFDEYDNNDIERLQHEYEQSRQLMQLPGELQPKSLIQKHNFNTSKVDFGSN